MANVTPKLVKCMIVNDDEKTQLVAYFNPKEIQIDKSVPWEKHPDSRGDNPTLEFTKAEPMTLSLELLFDTYEKRSDVYKDFVQRLESFAMVMGRQREEEKRPPMVTFIWGNFPRFKGVIESLSTKYTMFFPDGTPCRATCTVKLKQAATVQRKQEQGQSSSQSQQGTVAQEGQERRPDQLAGEGGDHRKTMDAAGGEITPGTQVPRQA